MKNHKISHRIVVIFIGFIKGLVAILLGGWGILGGGWSYYNLEKPLNFIVACPLILIGVSCSVIGLYTILASIFSTFYSHTQCPFCQTSIKFIDGAVIRCKNCGKIIDIKNHLSK